jgi:hypothetical protein
MGTESVHGRVGPIGALKHHVAIQPCYRVAPIRKSGKRDVEQAFLLPEDVPFSELNKDVRISIVKLKLTGWRMLYGDKRYRKGCAKRPVIFEAPFVFYWIEVTLLLAEAVTIHWSRPFLAVPVLL